jgi:hypothetical protein
VIVVANRLPISAKRDENTGEWNFQMSSGGLVTALQVHIHILILILAYYMVVTNNSMLHSQMIALHDGIGVTDLYHAFDVACIRHDVYFRVLLVAGCT